MGEWEKALDDLTILAFRLLSRSGITGRGLAKDLAYILGKRAVQLDIPRAELRRWFQGAYSRLWVHQCSLNAGLDMDYIQSTLMEGYGGEGLPIPRSVRSRKSKKGKRK